MTGVLTIGEILVEVRRKVRDVPLDVPAEFAGPYPSGAPAIFADAAAKLGFPSAIIGAVGDDEFGRLVLNRLRRDSVDVSRVKVLRNYLTGIAFVSYFSNGSRRFIFHLRHSASSKLSAGEIDEEYVAGFRHVHIMGSSLSINKGMRESCYKVVEIAHRSNATISLDPNLRPELIPPKKIREICKPIVEKAIVILPSVEEAKTLAGAADLDSACQKILNMGVEIIAVKMGSLGSTIYTQNEKKHIPAFKVEEVDPTGAGDTYDAAFIVGLLRGWNLEKAGHYANAAGALAVTKFGPMEGCPTHNEILKLIRRENRKF
jgi:sugar/nucleoside kinase (ribokinase family)